MHDLSTLDGLGIPGVNVVTFAFEAAAEAQCEAIGFQPAIVYVPHPIQNRTTAELRKLAEDHLDRILAQLVAAPTAKDDAEFGLRHSDGKSQARKPSRHDNRTSTNFGSGE